MRRIVDSPIGPLYLRAGDGHLTHLCFRPVPGTESDTEADRAVLDETERQLREYFDGKRTEFDLPLSMKGTDFQCTVWDALKTIPYGQTRTYGEIAAQVGRPKASRAVGSANHVNPIAIIVPCHRVIGANASLTGYAGGLDMKRFLLELERHGKV